MEIITYHLKASREIPAAPYLPDTGEPPPGQPAGAIKPCKQCGAADRFPSGVCRPCVKGYNAKWRAANPEQGKDYAAKHRLENPETVKANYARWYSKNPGKIKARFHKRRALKLIAGGSFTAGDIRAMLKQQKGRCIVCKIDIKKNYHIDHVMPLSLGGDNAIQNIQLLCPPCNRSKGASHPIAFMQSRGYLL